MDAPAPPAAPTSGRVGSSSEARSSTACLPAPPQSQNEELTSATLVSGADEDWSDDDEEGEKSTMQLGFLEPLESGGPPVLFEDMDWRNWDGGKVGGKPLWLDPEHLPSPQDLQCPKCSEAMAFLLQIYCPLDQPADAFHRTLFMFCCKKGACVDAGAVKCFRNQLPRENAFYPVDPKVSTAPPDCQTKRPHLCEVCGCKALSACAQCKHAHYCCRSHQKLHWKQHKRVCASADLGASAGVIPAALDFCFAEHEILVEAEEIDDSDLNLDKAHIWDDARTGGGHDEAEDAALTQSDYNKALSEQKFDKTYVSFLAHMERTGKQQVLRYCSDSLHRHMDRIGSDAADVAKRDKGRLFVSDLTKRDQQLQHVPPCVGCGGPRVFECQIMPQLLYYMQVDKDTNLVADPQQPPPTDSVDAEPKMVGRPVNAKGSDLNWGTLDLYTCAASCSAKGYVLEAVAMQALPLGI